VVSPVSVRLAETDYGYFDPAAAEFVITRPTPPPPGSTIWARVVTAGSSPTPAADSPSTATRATGG